jgi:putative Mg2+ transporter-C (MgtC) family protein
MVAKLALALLLGGLVGIERERSERPAGLRTHMLVCVGSALITLVSIGVATVPGDRTRIAAQIVSGIGFLGAGTIFRAGGSVRGLTTAAGLWVVAGIGMAVAAGGMLLPVAAVAAGMVFSLNMWLRGIEDNIVRCFHELVLSTARGHDVLARVFEGLEGRRVQVQRVQWLGDEAHSDMAVVRVRLRVPPTLKLPELTAWLSAQEGVRQVEWE